MWPCDSSPPCVLTGSPPPGPMPPGAVAQASFEAGLSHAAGCGCCGGRSAAATALNRLFQARIRGQCGWFDRVLAIVETPAAAAEDYTYDDGQFNSGNQAPVEEQVAQVRAASTKKNDDGGLLALTGNNTVAVVGGAAVLLMIGLIIMAFTRRRRVGGTSWE